MNNIVFRADSDLWAVNIKWKLINWVLPMPILCRESGKKTRAIWNWEDYHKCSHTRRLSYIAQTVLILSLWGSWHNINNVFWCSFHAVWYCKDSYIYICTTWSGRIKVHENTGSPYSFVFPKNQSWPSPLVHGDGHIVIILHSSVTWDTGHLCSRRSCQGKKDL